GKRQPLGDEMCRALGINIVDGANRFLLVGAAGIREVEAALGVERQVVGRTQRLALALRRRLADDLAGRVEMHGCMLTTIANQMRAIGQNLVAIGSTGFRPLLCLGARRLAVLIADNLDLCNDLSMRDVGIAVVIEDNALAVLGDDNDLVGLEVLVRRRVGSRQ